MTRLFGIMLLALVLIVLSASCNVGNQPAPVGTGPIELVEGPATMSPTESTAAATAQPLPLANNAANADVLFVRATQTAVNLWTFAVEVAHPDTGWDDYADGWDVVLPDGTVAKANPDDPFTRLLLHPHETEQPFTRSQSGIPIPTEVTIVTVRAHDLVDGFGGQEVVVDLTAVSGPNFAVTYLEP